MPSVSEIIVKYIREAIISGNIQEGEIIRQDQIAQLFNVSKIPVREALKQLEVEGFVEFRKNRGAMVSHISLEELEQFFEIRLLLETQLIRLAIPRMTEDTFSLADQICNKFVNTMDSKHWTSLNWELHACLYEPAQRAYMLKLVRTIYNKLERYLRMQMSFALEKNRANDEHRELIQACRDKNIDLSISLIEEHINGVQKSLYKKIPSY